MNLGLRTNRKADRRRNLRKAPEKFAFIQLERDDGGAVLDVSEGGLSFSTFGPVEQKGPIHFWFSLNLNERIDTWGEVAWTDETKKVGGLRFIRLPEKAGQQIREWISEPVSPLDADGGFAALEKPSRPSRFKAKKSDAVAKFVSKARAERSPLLTSSMLSSAEDSSGSTTSLGPLEKTQARGELVPMQRYVLEKRRQFRRGFLLGLGISAALAVASLTYLNYRHENKRPGTTSSDSAVAGSNAQASTPIVSPTTSIPDNPALDALAGVKANQNTPSSTAPRNPMAVAMQPRLRGSEIAVGNRPAQTTLESRSSVAPSQRKTSMTPRQLWAAAEGGSGNAAVALAELYIKGEGVPQNCDQARVLLLVASEKRNAEAIKRLHELDKTGCP
jgi:hypothetical protein